MAKSRRVYCGGMESGRSPSPVGLGHLVSDRNPRNLLLSLFNMTSFLEFLQVNKHKVRKYINLECFVVVSYCFSLITRLN